MGEDGIVIGRTLPEHLRDAGVILFEEAFGEEMRTAVPDRDRRMAYMGRVYSRDHVIVATRDDELLGMAGLSAKDGSYRGGLMDIAWDPRRHSDLLGLPGSIRAVLGLRLAAHRPAPGELYIDGIAVAAEARGQGIGTRLLDEIAAIARESRMRWVRLDVVDTNPRAQALYERLGYKVTRVQSFHYKERFVGFGATISMELPVGVGPAT